MRLRTWSLHTWRTLHKCVVCWNIHLITEDPYEGRKISYKISLEYFDHLVPLNTIRSRRDLKMIDRKSFHLQPLRVGFTFCCRLNMGQKIRFRQEGTGISDCTDAWLQRHTGWAYMKRVWENWPNTVQLRKLSHNIICTLM